MCAIQVRLHVKHISKYLCFISCRGSLTTANMSAWLKGCVRIFQRCGVAPGTVSLASIFVHVPRLLLAQKPQRCERSDMQEGSEEESDKGSSSGDSDSENQRPTAKRKVL